LLLDSFKSPLVARVSRASFQLGRKLDARRGQRLREALERLGPIFVKFGQVLSTRRDCCRLDIADELAKLQDRRAAFSLRLAVATIERALRKPWPKSLRRSTREPIASASIAQVHFAVVRDRSGTLRDVAVKVLRPGMLSAIDKDLNLMRMMAGWLDSCRLTASGSNPVRWWPNLTSTCTMSST